MKFVSVLLASAMLLFVVTAPVAAKAKKAEKADAQDFYTYVQNHRDTLQYQTAEKVEKDSKIEVLIVCSETAQQKLIEVLDGYAIEKYYFEATAPGSVMFHALFAKPAQTKKCPGRVKVSCLRPVLESFKQYAHLEGVTAPAELDIQSPVGGVVSELAVPADGQVQAGQVLAVINKGQDAEVKKLSEEVVKRQRILQARKNWKEKNEKAIQQAETSLAEATALLEQKKAQTLCEIKAPYNGQVVGLTVAVNMAIQPNTTLMKLTTSEVMAAPAPLNEETRSLFAVDEEVDGSISEISGLFRGRVQELGDQGIVVHLSNADGRIEPGFHFAFQKFLREQDQALVIPADVLLKAADGYLVYVVSGKHAKMQKVEVGAIEGGKAMVLSGLTAESEVISSNLECLKEGKSVRLLREKEAKKAKKEKKAEEEKPAVEEEKPVAEEEAPAEVTAEKKVSPIKNKLRAGLYFEGFAILDENITKFYDKQVNIFGIDVAYNVYKKLDVWAAFSLYSNKGTSDINDAPIRLKITPIWLGVRYRIIKKKIFEPFVGAGLNYYSYHETDPENTWTKIGSSALGFHIQGGCYFDIKNFLLAQIFVKYNFIKDTFEERDLDFGGYEFGLGLIYKF